MLQCEQYQEAMGIYIQDENKFVFNNVLISQSAKARFRLTNPGKIPCKLSLQVKAVLNKVCLCVTAATVNISCFKESVGVYWIWLFQMSMNVRSAEAFELSPTRMRIPSHSHAFATITFTPQNMQTYLGVFEASLEGATG